MTLELPSHMIALSSPEGTSIFIDSSTKTPNYTKPFWKLCQHFECQKNAAFCGVASCVMVLNSLQNARSIRPRNSGIPNFHYFDQENFFNKLTRQKIHPSENVTKRGMMFQELVDLLQCQDGIQVESHKGIHLSLDQFRELLKKNSITEDSYIIIYYDRSKIEQEGGPHISPIGAYSDSKDMFLLMDVSRYKYETGWIKTEELYQGVHYNDNLLGYYGGVVIVRSDPSVEFAATSVRKPRITDPFKILLYSSLAFLFIGVWIGIAIGLQIK